METWRKVFRIEHRLTREGAFRSCAVDIDWHAFTIPCPGADTSEAAISNFVCRNPNLAIFAYLTLRSILQWFETHELTELDAAGYHVVVFKVSNHPSHSACSQVQAVFIRDRAELVKHISLADLTCDTLSQ